MPRNLNLPRHKLLSYLRAVFRSPSLTLPLLQKDRQAVIKSQIRQLTGVSERAVDEAFLEIPSESVVLRNLGGVPRDWWPDERGPCGGRAPFGARGPFAVVGGPTLYALAMLSQPAIVVETGVSGGVSSAYILSALEHNSKGHLYSIDLDAPSILPPGKETGWIVPGDLRDRWTLLLGDAKDLLPELLDDLGSFEMFLHDSNHSYNHMMWEFRVAWRALASGGLLLTDDVFWNESFFDFAKLVRETPHPLFSTRIGGLMKN